MLDTCRPQKSDARHTGCRLVVCALTLGIALIPWSPVRADDDSSDDSPRASSQARQIAALQASIGTLTSQVSALQGTVANQAGQLATLQTALNNESVARQQGDTATLTTARNYTDQSAAPIADKLVHFSRQGNEVFITGANLHLVNGLGTTTQGNGLGNLIVGYNELRNAAGLQAGPDSRTGSHNVVVGQMNNYPGCGGLVVGAANEASGLFCSVSGGQFNHADNFCSAVSGGSWNFANREGASISGGLLNHAWGEFSSISGGQGNQALGRLSSVTGGVGNTVTGVGAIITGVK